MNYLVPIGILTLLIFAAFKGVNCFDAFIDGASQAIPMLLKLLPTLAAVLAAITIFRESGAAERLSQACAPALNAIGIPAELSTLIILRPFSGSGALAMLSEIFSKYGPDSFIGLCASVCVGSTETIFYTLAVYCGAAGVKSARYALPAALISGLVGTLLGIALIRAFI